MGGAGSGHVGRPAEIRLRRRLADVLNEVAVGQALKDSHVADVKAPTYVAKPAPFDLARPDLTSKLTGARRSSASRASWHAADERAATGRSRRCRRSTPRPRGSSSTILSAAAAADVKEVTTAIQSVGACQRRRAAGRRAAVAARTNRPSTRSLRAGCYRRAVRRTYVLIQCLVRLAGGARRHGILRRIVRPRWLRGAAAAKAVGAGQGRRARRAAVGDRSWRGLVAALTSKRYSERSPSAVSVDPRYLVFELTASVVLRDQR